ncbi:MAG: hypothetical protein ACOYBE_11110 [Blautia sp.]|jgi:hypothetical protein
MNVKEKTMNQEVMEAVWAGEETLRCLRRAQEQLEGAKNWGIFDMLGGNFFSGWMKHSKMEKAALDMEQAKNKLTAFQRELKDVSLPLELRMDIHGFLVFADFFFDGLVTDWLVQSKINEAREQVDTAIYQVEKILADLRYMLEEVKEA